LNDTYLETFTNECNEDWWFNYNIENDMGVIWGNDDLIIDKKFYIFDGIHDPQLVLSDKEKDWIKNVWEKYSKPKSIYLNLDTKIQTKKITYLENNYCPICLNQKTEFEDHHCIPASEGGSDDVVNMLRICNSCHSLITNGCLEDRYIRHLTAIYHQMFLFGIDFYKMNPLNNKRFGNKDKGLYLNRPHIKEVIDYYDGLDEQEQIEFNDKFIKKSLYYYKYNRSIMRNVINEEINKNYQAKIS